MATQIRMFTLSTCSHCKATKKFMRDNGIEFDYIDVDLLTGDARQKILEEVERYNPNRSFPTILIGSKVIVGFKEDAIREALSLNDAE